ncbi:MAG: PMT-2 domain-containing protein [Eubacteriales bacterium]
MSIHVEASRKNRLFHLFYEKPSSFPEWLFFLLRCAFLVIFTCVFLNVCFLNASSMFQFDMPLSVTIAGALLAVLFLLLYKTREISKSRSAFFSFVRRFPVLSAAAGLLVLFALQVVMAQAIYRPIGWDCSTIVESAAKGDLSSQRFYFSTYPNNLLMFCLLKYLLKAFFSFGGTDYWLFLAVVNILVVDIAIFLVFLICRKQFGTTCGFVSLLLFVLLFGFSPWLVVPYSDTFSMLFFPLVFLLFLKWQEEKRIVWKGVLLFLIGFLSMVGYYIKPYTLIALFSIVIYLFIQNLNRLKQLGLCLLSFALLFAGAASCGAAYNVTVKEPYAEVLDYSQALPMSYFFMMGLNTKVSGSTGKTLYGAYSGEDNLFAYTLKTPEEKKAGTLAEAKRRIAAYTPRGYARFLYNKANWVFSDGTFWVEGEGYDVDQPSVSTAPFSKWVQSYLRFYGANYPRFANFVQAVWIVFLFLLICPLLNNSDDYKNALMNILRIAGLGFLLYQLLFEARPRYIISALPVFVLLAVCGFSYFHKNLSSYEESDFEISE